MDMRSIIEKKRDKNPLTVREIKFVAQGAASKSIPDYQLSALLMAIYLNGMDEQETSFFANALAVSGNIISWPAGMKVADKHSTGGVGDKASLVSIPLAAALGTRVAKMSGRGLGHTGGTIDKLESIPLFEARLTRAQLVEQVRTVGGAFSMQTSEMAPADRHLYALRDMSATAESLPLIASSVMGKKIAAGASVIVLDVKCGRGAFIKELDGAREQARIMCEIGQGNGKEMHAVISNMEQPLGRAVGNSLEVIEAIECLKGRGPKDLQELCAVLAAKMSGRSVEDALGEIESGAALAKFGEIIEAQGGNRRVIYDYSLFKEAAIKHEIKSAQTGFVKTLDPLLVAEAAIVLGAGRRAPGQGIDHAAGVYLHKKIGDYAEKGEALATIYTDIQPNATTAEELLREAYVLDERLSAAGALILDEI